jgi:hypothetical protein
MLYTTVNVFPFIPLFFTIFHKTVLHTVSNALRKSMKPQQSFFPKDWSENKWSVVEFPFRKALWLKEISSIWVRTKSYLRRCCEVLPEVTLQEVTWPEVTSVTRPEVTLSGSMICPCATGSCTIPALVGSFDRKWQSHVTGSGHVRKRSWPEVGYVHALFFPALFS